MTSPLGLFEQVAKEFNVTGEKLVHPRQQRAYVDAQITEQALITNRLLVDAARARQSVQDSKDDTTKAAHQSKLQTFENDLRQMSKTLDFFLELRDDLAKKYPAVDKVAAERPDGF